MVSLRRVVAVGGFLAVAAILTSSHVWGEPGRDKELKDVNDGNKTQVPEKVDGRLSERLGFSRFIDKSVVYETTKGDLLFAGPIKPTLPATPARPRDYLVLVDTS